MSTDIPEGEAAGRLRRPARIVRPARRTVRPAAAPDPAAAPGRRAPSGRRRPGGFGLDPRDLAEALLADLAEVAGQDDPFEFEMLISSFCAVLEVAGEAAGAGVLPPDTEARLIGRFEARGDALGLAVLATLALLARGETGATAARAAARLWRAGVVPPRWFDELDRSILVDECVLARRELDGVLILLCSFRRAGRRHAFAVVLHDEERAPAEAIVPLPAEVLPARLADLVTHLVPADEIDAVSVEHLEAQRARAVLETALRCRSAQDRRLGLEARFAQWDEGATAPNVLGAPPYPTMVAALCHRVEAMPAPDCVLPGEAARRPEERAGTRDGRAPGGSGGEREGEDRGRGVFDAENAEDAGRRGLPDLDFAAAFGAEVLAEPAGTGFDAARALGAFPGPAGPDSFGGSRGAGLFGPGALGGFGPFSEGPRTGSRASGRLVEGLPPRRRAADGPAPVYRLRIDLKGAKPPIWRRLEVPGDMTLAALDEAIQTAFEWEGCHLHVFETPYGDFGDVEPDLGPDVESEVTVEQVLAGPGAKLVYVYDFGDYWEHVVRVELTEPARPGAAYPRCTGGRRAAPPEDCGGLEEYEESLRRHGDAGADVFDREELNRRLAEDPWQAGPWLEGGPS